MSEPVQQMNIYQKIHAVMTEVDMVVKEDKKVNNQYRYVSHDAVTKRLRPAILRHRLHITPSVQNRAQDGNRCEMDVELTVVNIDNPADRFVFRSSGYGIDPQDKGTGKAMSYAVKMALLKLFMLESAEEDNEADVVTNYRGKTVVKPSVPVPQTAPVANVAEPQAKAAFSRPAPKIETNAEVDW